MNKSKKKLREEAIKKEKERRYKECLDRSPLNHNEMLSLINYVGGEIMKNGHNSDFTYTNKWLTNNGINLNDAISFFSTIRVKDDWSLCIEGDPYSLFGETSERLSWMPIEENQLNSLIDFVEEQIVENGCNHELLFTKKWLEDNDCITYPTLMALMAQGGGCDCEVVLNVESEGIYP